MAFLKETGNYQQKCSVLTENNYKNGNKGNNNSWISWFYSCNAKVMLNTKLGFRLCNYLGYYFELLSSNLWFPHPKWELYTKYWENEKQSWTRETILTF